MRTSDKKRVEQLESELNEYYDFWFNYWYDGSDFYDSDPDGRDNWHDWSSNINRIRQERLDEIFDLNKSSTIGDIWPDRKDLK